MQLGTFSEDDIDEAFKKIDLDDDGKISKEELEVLFRGWSEKQGLDDQALKTMVQDVMVKWDNDDSGYISKAEFKRNALNLGEQVHPVIYQLSACMFLMCLPFGIIVPYEPQLVHGLGITAAQFGLAQGAMFVTKFLVNIPVTDVVERVGSKPVLVGCTTLLGVSLGGLSMVTSLEHLILCRAIGGVAIAGLSASVAAPAVRIMTPLNRARSNAPFMMAMNAGIALGPAIGGVLSGFVPMETAFAGVGCLYFASAAANYMIYTETAPARGSSSGNNPLKLFSTAFSSWFSILKGDPDVRVLCGAQAMLWAAVSGTNMTLLPLLLIAEPYNFTASAIGVLSAGLATMGIVITQPLAIFADTYGRRTALGLGSAIMGTSMALVPLMGTPFAISGALATTAVGQNLLSPSIQALMLDTVSRKDPSQSTQAMSLLRSVQDIGMVSGAGMVGWVGTHYGFTAGYELSGSIILAMGLAAFLRLPPPPPRVKVD